MKSSREKLVPEGLSGESGITCHRTEDKAQVKGPDQPQGVTRPHQRRGVLEIIQVGGVEEIMVVLVEKT